MKTWAVLAMLACSWQAQAQTVERIAVLDVAVADTLQVLGASDKVVALPKQQLPAYLGNWALASVGDIGRSDAPDYNKLRQIKPDVIYVAAASAKQVTALKHIATTEVRTINHGSFWADTERETLKLAEQVGKREVAQQRLNGLATKIAHLRQQVQKQGETVVVLEHDDGHYRWQPQAAYQGLLYGVLGAKPPPNMPTKSMEVTQEQLQQWQAERILLLDISGSRQGPSLDRSVLEEAARDTPAVRMQQIAYLNPDFWLGQVGGLQGLNLQLDELGKQWAKP